MQTLVQEKVDQAVRLLPEFGLDAWLTFVRETAAGGDPVLPLIYGDSGLTWESALILFKNGERVAIVGRFEQEPARLTGAYTQVIPYDESIRPVLAEIFTRHDPGAIGINTSLSDVHADGLTHGMYTLLQRYLEGTSYPARLTSAEKLAGALRGRKTPAEVARIRKAVTLTGQIFDEIIAEIQPGMTERDVYSMMQARTRQMGLGLAWAAAGCPTVNSGPESPSGHVAPTDIAIQPGHLLHFDFGVRSEGYCSDIQRLVYFRRPGETQAPPEIQRAFDTVVRAIQASAAMLKPGMIGKDVDAVARSILIEAGYPEYKHALGHQLGREAHDGGALLGPAWERYGDSPFQKVEAGQVFTLEPTMHLPGIGAVGLEEDVLVTETGVEFLGPPQTELIYK